MAEILILDPNEEAMVKYKAMLKGMEQEYDIIYTTYPEQAMDILSERHVAVVLTEDDMGILNAVELSEMIELMHPEIVQLLMTEVLDIPKVLSTLHKANIYEILLKPFQFAEDMEEPLKRAMQEYEQRIGQNGVSGLSKERIQKFDMEYDRLKQERLKRSRDYSSLYNVLGGIVEGNLKSWKSAGSMSEQDQLRMKGFIQQIVKEYVDVFVFGTKDLKEYFAALSEKYEQNSYGCKLQVEDHCGSTISVKKAKELYYAVFLMEHLCRQTLMKYQIRVTLDISRDFYVMQFVCDLKESMIREKMVYREESDYLRNVMHELTERCMKKLYTKSMKGYKGNPYVAAVTVLME